MLVNKLKGTGQDKLFHFFGCGIISLVMCIIALYFHYSKIEIAIFSLFMVLFISIAKEYYDCIKKNPTDFSYKDITWGMIGGFTGIVPFII